MRTVGRTDKHMTKLSFSQFFRKRLKTIAKVHNLFCPWDDFNITYYNLRLGLLGNCVELPVSVTKHAFSTDCYTLRWAEVRLPVCNNISNFNKTFHVRLYWVLGLSVCQLMTVGE
jgi:hypothetical protein